MRKIIAVLSILIYELLVLSNVAYACSCVAIGPYFEEKLADSTFIGIVKITELGEIIETVEGENKTNDRDFKFEVSERIYNTDNSNPDSAHQTRIIEHEIKNCKYQCDSYIGSSFGSNMDLIEGSSHMVILEADGNVNKLVASIPLSSDGKTTDKFLQFSNGVDIKEVIEYLSSYVEVRNDSNKTPVRTDYTIYLITIILMLAIIFPAGFIILKGARTRK